MKYIYVTLLISTLYTTPYLCNAQNSKATANQPNIILLIGDGMGLSELSSAYYYGSNEPNFSRFSNIGLINTSSANSKITDSGAGGTAFACGIKTYNGAIGVNVDTTTATNIVEVLSNKDYNTGVISTSGITHATPASFYAHVSNRGMQDDIAIQLVDSEIDFFAGGGEAYFANRKDGINLIDSLETSGFCINCKTSNSKGKYGYLLADDGMPTMLEGRGDFLPEYTEIALNYFSNNTNPFFLMVEGSQIDWAGHNNDADYLIAEVIDFDKAIGVALDFAEEDGNTLVIVLADHETGGFTLAANGNNYNDIKPVFSSKGHSTTLIPVFAFGPSSDDFTGIYQNYEIYYKILNAR